MVPSSKPTLHALKTSKCASLPSELPRSPYPGTPLFLKQEENLTTPISPPTAYTDFLKAVSSPIIIKSGKITPTSAPLSDTSACSSSSSSSCSSDPALSASASASASALTKTTVPPSPYFHSRSAPTTGPLRRLRISSSPICSPGTSDSPTSAFSMRSPFTIRSPFEWDLDAKRWSLDAAKTGGTLRPVSVRQTVTRTVTYTPRMDLAPPPKGKKRRLE